MNHRIKLVQKLLNITQLEQWKSIRPVQVLGLTDIGPATLNDIRIYLAGHGITLDGDGSANHWLETLSQPGMESKSRQVWPNEFAIVIDRREQKPFAFDGIRGDAKQNKLPLKIETLWQMLPTGDYSIAGMEDEVAVERKGPGDAHGTFLSYGERLERWENELGRLAAMPAACVVVECSLGELIESVESRGKRDQSTLRKSLHRSIVKWQMDYQVPFVFCDSRRLAELTTFRWLARWWKKANERKVEKAAGEFEALI